MEELYATYLDRKNLIIGSGFLYEEAWEHEIDFQMGANKDFSTFVNSLPYTDPLTPADAFAGGRTELFCMYAEAKEDNKIYFMDVLSLYPKIMYTSWLPKSHPVIIFGNQIKGNNIEEYFGLIKVKILPPNDLTIPVLGQHMSNKKFVFALCRTCAHMLQTHKCAHTPEERAFIGVWVSEEIKLALKYGYKILQIYEIWHWSEENRSTELFKGYIRNYLQIKVESSGYPPEYNTQEKKKIYIDMWESYLGVKLDENKITFNSGKRKTSKLALNSLWGKICQKSREKTIFIDSPAAYFDLLLSDKDKVTNVQFVNDEMLEV